MDEVIKPSLKYFYIADQLFPFDVNDKVYKQSKPNEVEEDNETCPCCRKHTFDEKMGFLERKQCNYCPYDYCTKCCYKTRFYPWGLRDDDGTRPYGKICKRCDHKFYIKDIFDEFTKKMEMSEKKEEAKEAKAARLADELAKAQEEYDYRSSEIKDRVAML